MDNLVAIRISQNDIWRLRGVELALLILDNHIVGTAQAVRDPIEFKRGASGDEIAQAWEEARNDN